MAKEIVEVTREKEEAEGLETKLFFDKEICSSKGQGRFHQILVNTGKQGKFYETIALGIGADIPRSLYRDRLLNGPHLTKTKAKAILTHWKIVGYYKEEYFC